MRFSNFAFVRFRSGEIAEKVLDCYNSYPWRFKYNGIQLKIDRSKEKSKSRPSTNVSNSTASGSETQVTKINFNIAEAHYGTLLTTDAMKNIQTNLNYECELGLIAYPLMPPDRNVHIRFEIYQENEQLAFVLVDYSFLQDTCSELKFEWNFRE